MAIALLKYNIIIYHTNNLHVAVREQGYMVFEKSAKTDCLTFWLNFVKISRLWSFAGCGPIYLFNSALNVIQSIHRQNLHSAPFNIWTAVLNSVKIYNRKTAKN